MPSAELLICLKRTLRGLDSRGALFGNRGQTPPSEYGRLVRARGIAHHPAQYQTFASFWIPEEDG